MSENFRLVEENKPYKKIKLGSLIYLVNEKEQTAGICDNDLISGDVLIPRSINYETQEFIITSILKGAFKDSDQIKLVQFPSDSELQIIEKEAFTNSSIEKIIFPSSVTKICENSFYQCENLSRIEFPPNSKLHIIESDTFSNSSIEELLIPSSISELKERWCFGTPNLTKVTIFQNFHQNIKKIDENLIVGKSNSKSEEFDVLVFVNRRIEKVTIPSFIKILGPYSFCDCSIEEIVIPSHITKICEGTFHSCYDLQKIEFQQNSELQIIEKDAFYRTSFNDLLIPSTVTELKDGWCSFTHNLKKVTIMPNNKNYNNYDEYNLVVGKSNSKSEEFDVLVFVNRNIKTVTIPSFIRIIQSYAFSYCIFDKIVIPRHITHIGDSSFSWCTNLEQIEIESDSQLQSIGKNTFYKAKIKKFIVPRHVKKIDEQCFYYCRDLCEIEIEKDSELQVIEKNAFTNSSIKTVFIPQHVNKICECSFSLCFELETIEFDPNSELQVIENKAFYLSSITSLTIPSSVCELKEGWCNGVKNLVNINIIPNKLKNILLLNDKLLLGKSDSKSDDFDVILFACRDIKTVEIPPNIKWIASHSFAYSQIEKVVIPSKVKRIGESAFSHCEKLQEVEIPLNSELTNIDKSAFYKSSIESLFVPPHITKISEYTFHCCIKLKELKFSEDSELKKIESFAFLSSSIESFTIPPKVSELENDWFFPSKLSKVKVMPNNQHFKLIDGNLIVGKTSIESDKFDALVFAYRNIRSITIPHHITQICEGAFGNCEKLQKIEIPSNSQLKRIDRYAFHYCPIVSIYIPPNVTRIDEPFLNYCYHLKIIEIDEEIQSIDKRLFIDCRDAFVMISKRLCPYFK
ncbi:hypothetical protein M9Y10_010685 [Tritrichomonas musculus]|uniref:Surface antigen BspA-like n=1 Tax=Tritrichomonas musculus TaxID=1915356 RepID=A0ABR2IMB5_9EUKA